MIIALPVLAVAFTAFCVWLTVRFVNRRERWAKWTLVAIVGLPVLYVASFGPACWIVSRNNLNGNWLFIAYRPLVWIMENGPESAFTSLVWYSLVGTAEHWGWEFDDEGHFFQFGVTR